MRDDYPELYQTLAHQAAGVLRELGMAEEQAGFGGELLAELVRTELGGIYLPKGSAYLHQQRDERIMADFRRQPGDYAGLARKFHLTEVRVRQIVNACIERERSLRRGAMR